MLENFPHVLLVGGEEFTKSHSRLILKVLVVPPSWISVWSKAASTPRRDAIVRRPMRRRRQRAQSQLLLSLAQLSAIDVQESNSKAPAMVWFGMLWVQLWSY